jgi:hypothetical protein
MPRPAHPIVSGSLSRKSSIPVPMPVSLLTLRDKNRMRSSDLFGGPPRGIPPAIVN